MTAQLAGTSPGPGAGTSRPAFARNSVLNLIGLTAPLVVGLLAMPSVVDGLGPDRFGVLGLVWTVFAYLTLLDLGLARATTRFAAEAIAIDDEAELAALTHTAAAVQLAIGAAVALVGIALAAPLVDAVLEVRPALRDEAVLAFAMIALTAPAMALANTCRGLLEAGQRFGVVNLVRTPASAANYLVPLVGVWLDWSLVAIVAGMVAVRVATLLAYGAAAARAWPALLRRSRFERDRLRRMLSFGGWISVSSALSPLLVYLDRFAIGALIGMAAVGWYTAPHEVVTRLSLLPTSIVATIFPAFAAAGVAQDAAPRREMLFVRATKYILALAAPPLLALAALAPELLDVWLGADFAAHAAPALAILALGMIFNAVAYVPSALVQAAGRADVTARLHLLELPLHVLLLWLLIPRLGIAGAALAWSARVVLDAALLYFMTGRLGLVQRAAFRRERLPATIASLAVAGALLAGCVALLEPPAARAAAVCTILAAWAWYAWTRALGTDERAGLRAALRPRARVTAGATPGKSD